MTLLFISRRGDSLGLAMRCRDEGYPLSFYIEETSLAGDGIVDRPLFSKHLINRGGECIASNVNQLLTETKPDLVVVDGVGMGKVADYLREKSLPVFGSSHWTDTISSSPDYTRDMMKRVGIEKWKGEDGIRLECGLWWNGLQPLLPFIVWNEDRFMTGSLGPRVESASNIVSSPHLHTALVVDGVGKMERLLRKSKFRGIISLSSVVTKTKVLGISFTTSTLYLPSLLELYKGSVTDLLLAIASGRKSEGELTTDYALSLLLSIPPYPASVPECNKTAIHGVSPSNLKHISLLGVEQNGESYESVGGKLMWVSARGRDVGECKRRVMKTVSNLSIEDVQYRTDSTRRLLSEESKLQEWGYLLS